MRLRLFVALAAVISTSVAFADDDSPVGDYSKRTGVRERGTVKQLAKRKVSVAGRATMTVEQIANSAFAEPRKLSTQLATGRTALFADAVVSEDVVELDDVTVFQIKTDFTVSDPTLLRKKSARFKSYEEIPKGSLKRADLSKVELDAIAAGKGDFSVTNTYVIPKKAATRDAKGNLVVPTVGDDGIVDYTKTKTIETSFAGNIATSGDEKTREEEPEPPKEMGESTFTAKFLTGFTTGDAYNWIERFDFPTGYFKIHAHADWSVGLRIPFEVTGTMDPRKLVSNKQTNTNGDYTVKLDLKTVDADAAFYRAVGVEEQYVKNGQELVLEGGFWLKIELKALGKMWVDRKFPKNGVNLDEGQDFVPPFGNNDSGPELWVPASVTGTTINLGVLKGAAQLGVKITGDSDVTVDYVSLDGADEIKSSYRGTKQRVHELVWKGPGEKKLETEIAPLDGKRKTKPYGYRLSDPEYDWHVSLKPGVKLSFTINLAVWKHKYELGTLWFPVELPLGDIELGRHAGTTGVYRVKHGTQVLKGN